MKDIVKKSFLLGLGVASMTKDKVEKIAKELVKNGTLTAKESKELLQRALKEANKQTKKIRSLANKEANIVVKKMGIVSKSQIKKLKIELRKLEKNVLYQGRKTARKIMRNISR